MINMRNKEEREIPKEKRPGERDLRSSGEREREQIESEKEREEERAGRRGKEGGFQRLRAVGGPCENGRVFQRFIRFY